ncbi:MAG: ATP-dependent RecD-like DNA helicase [Anaerolineales bacterium]|nr:ATP-dependent RecD-like DNA helicase [Anaerolineales bacterium]
MQDSLEGSVERITYYAGETGFSVIRIKPARRSQVPQGARTRDGLVTVVGELPEINPGESLKLTGQWMSHPKHGRQFRAERCEQVLPADVEGLRRYLGSGMIRGIGPVMADRIVHKFGLDTLVVIETKPARLREVLGIGPKRIQRISTAWQEQKAIQEVMIFLQAHGVSTRLAVKIYKQYGDASVDVVQMNPYQLARDIWGIGFKTADKIAQDLGMPEDAPARIEAGVIYSLSQQADEGHVYVPRAELAEKTAGLLAVKEDLVEYAFERLETDEQIKKETLQAETPDRVEEAIYLAPFYYSEVGVTNRLRKMAESPGSRLDSIRTDQLRRPPARDGVPISDQQWSAIVKALTRKVSVLTGGPGTGKTTALRALIQALLDFNCTFALASPTGRAAKRLSEATGQPAATIHRLLEYSPSEGFQRGESNPLPVDMIIIDEASMLDLVLTHNLLKAIDPKSHLMLVGDVDQLPSVGAGDVLRDIIASGTAAVTRLDFIFRQAQDSLIITNAHRINAGMLPLFPRSAQDFFLFVEPDPEKGAALLVDVVKSRIPGKFGLDPLEDIQVLSPMYRGSSGVANLNQELQQALNPPTPKKPERRMGGRTFRVGDRLMQTRNNYDKDIFNGDIGRLVKLDVVEQIATINFEGRRIEYDWMELDQVVHAFAISVHKSQGSEYPAVVVPVTMQHYLMLQRNLLYTAVTRARKLVVLVGTKKAIAIAVRNDKVAQRYTALDLRLKKGLIGANQMRLDISP